MLNYFNSIQVLINFSFHPTKIRMGSLAKTEHLFDQEDETSDDFNDDFGEFADFQDSSSSQKPISSLTNNLNNLIANTFEQSNNQENLSCENDEKIQTDLFPNKSTQRFSLLLAFNLNYDTYLFYFSF